MENDLIWLRTSLFADKSQWAYILQYAVKPYINDLLNKDMFRSLYIEFNYSCGENIRFALKTESANANIIAQQADSFFKKFFLSANLYQKPVTLPVSGVFMPFPPNTIQYGLYESIVDQVGVSGNPMCKISHCIMAATEGEIVDEEMLIMLAFYMNCALITQLELTLQNKIPNLYNLDHQYKLATLTEDYLLEKYRQNENLLNEVKQGIQSHKPAVHDENPPWLINWMDDCKQFVYKDISGQNRIYRCIISSINKQLGLNNNMILLVYYFINKVYSVQALN